MISGKCYRDKEEDSQLRRQGNQELDGLHDKAACDSRPLTRGKGAMDTYLERVSGMYKEQRDTAVHRHARCGIALESLGRSNEPLGIVTLLMSLNEQHSDRIWRRRRSRGALKVLPATNSVDFNRQAIEGNIPLIVAASHGHDGVDQRLLGQANIFAKTDP